MTIRSDEPLSAGSSPGPVGGHGRADEAGAADAVAGPSASVGAGAAGQLTVRAPTGLVAAFPVLAVAPLLVVRMLSCPRNGLTRTFPGMRPARAWKPTARPLTTCLLRVPSMTCPLTVPPTAPPPATS